MSLATADLKLLGEALQAHWSDIVVREVLYASAGLKVTRLSLSLSESAKMRHFLEPFGVALALGSRQRRFVRDIGKGGWSNAFGEEPEPGDSGGFFRTYIAADQADVEVARLQDEIGAPVELGASLGIPNCCAEFYVEFKAAARRKQNDFTPFSLRRTNGPPPYDPWTNHLSQYFGSSLLSFFPCSFRCQHASAVARTAYGFLQEVASSIAGRALALHRSSVLYTEYRGIYLFQDATLEGGCIHYNWESILATMRRSSLGKSLREGDHLRVNDIDDIEIYRGDRSLRRCHGENVSVCIF